MNTQKIWDYIYINFLSNLSKDEQEWWAEDNAKEDDIEVEFKAGDRVCYKTHPNICIGYVSYDINLGGISFSFDDKTLDLIPICTNADWAKHFGNGVCSNTMRIIRGELMLYSDNKTKN